MMNEKSHNSVLLDFDSLVDIRFGVILYLRNMYQNYSKSSSTPKYINKEYLFQDLNILMIKRVVEGEESIINCFSNQFRDSALQIESDILQNDLEHVLELATETIVVDLIKRYKTAADGAIKSTIFCTDDTRYKFAMSKKYNNYSIIRKINSVRELDLESYARLILYDTKYIDEFNPNYKSICVLGYGENFVDKLDYGSLNPEILIKYNTSNFSVINPYKHITRPVG